MTNSSSNNPHQENRKPGAKQSSMKYYLYGAHAVLAALQNPDRKNKRLFVTEDAYKNLGDRLTDVLDEHPNPPPVETATKKLVDKLSPPDAVHQGILLETKPLNALFLKEWLRKLPTEKPVRLLVLDQVTDPHNVGAIVRTAAAFKVDALLLTWRNAPEETPTLAKIASGGLEHLPIIRVGNLSESISSIKDNAFSVYGLAGEATTELQSVTPEARSCLILGSEGKGLREKTRNHCDALIKLPTSGEIRDINVSNAAAISLFHFRKD
jgi:23S rRNA (guanosine2251-2'-O)-methyltransferase